MRTIPSFLDNVSTSTRRYFLRARRTPETVFFSTIQPILFVLLFVYVLGSAIDVRGVSYREYLLAGVFCQVTVFGSALTGIGLATDKATGMSQRLRTLPISPLSTIIGRTTMDLLTNILVVAIMMAVGLAVGWRTHTSPTKVLLGLLVLLLFCYSMSWVSAAVGLSARSVEVVQTAGVLWLYPLTFVSNVFVPIEGLVAPLRVFAEWNPVSVVTQAQRELYGNLPGAVPTAWPLRHAVPLSFAYYAMILAIFMPLSAWLFRRE